MATESVWDYPRPPRLEETGRHVVVMHGDLVIAESRRPWRVLETSHPPVYYIPAQDVRTDLLDNGPRRTFCEFKGEASYADLRLPTGRVPAVAWSYRSPSPAYAAIAGAYAFYANRVDRCLVDDERVAPQAGDFYGGWITSEITGPFKGAPGTSGW
jgi:uncharacterized protein (DUF427 family)